MTTRSILKLKTDSNTATPDSQKQVEDLGIAEPNVEPLQNKASSKPQDHVTKDPVISSETNSTNISTHNITFNKQNLTEDQKAALQAKIARNKLEFKETFKLLNKLYPHCFNKDRKPLAIGIHKELGKLHPDILPKQRIFKFLNRYCNGFYRKGLVICAIRINLDGSSSSLVTKQEVEFLSKYNKADKSK